ncbi:MAG: hypothetical protein ACTS68_00380 [Candidatus Hodgkinia cicadicola]
MDRLLRIETNGFVNVLRGGLRGKLSVQGKCFIDCGRINAEVLVSVWDLNVVTNTLNLKFVEDEEGRTILEEVSCWPPLLNRLRGWTVGGNWANGGSC